MSIIYRNFNCCPYLMQLTVKMWLICMIVIVGSLCFVTASQVLAIDSVSDSKAQSKIVVSESSNSVALKAVEAAARYIIIPDNALDVVKYAAVEFQYHVKKATDVNIGIYTESNNPAGYGRIYLGNCLITKTVGIDSSSFSANSFTVKTIGPDLFIAGNDSSGEVLGMLHMNNTRCGTLFGVYHFLENQMGIRWLWPGEIGEVVPRQSLSFGTWNVTVTPQLLHTRLRDYANRTATGWSSQQACDDFFHAQSVWLRRHRFAQSISLDYPEGFLDYWARFGTTHPEYFNRLPDGTRRSDPYYFGGEGRLISMCVSEPNLWEQKVQDWVDTRTAEKPWVNCNENDTDGKCTCDKCLAWDVEPLGFQHAYGCPWPQRQTYAANAFNSAVPSWDKYLGPVSDRYAKFYLSVQQRAQQIDTNAIVIGYAYSNYNKPPVQTQLNDHVVLAIVPALMYPWTDSKRQAFREQWSGWTSTGVCAYLRPNYFIDGHNMPIYFADKFGQDFIYAYQRGMIATDFDSLTGQYATQGPNLYLLARINADGTSDVNDILNEYYHAFGPAESAVRAYFAHWKAISESVTDQQASALGLFYWNFYQIAPQIFTSDVMAQGRALMRQAQSAASGNADAEAKVAYLEKGLRNAELTLSAQLAWDNYNQFGNIGGWVEAIDKLDTYRALVDSNYISNMGFLYTFERQTWQRTIGREPVSAGEVIALSYDTFSSLKVDGYDGQLFFCDDNNDMSIFICLDLQSKKIVNAINYTNREDVATNYNAKAVKIWVAPNESDPDFNPFFKSGYSRLVFNGDFIPSSNQAALVRGADINDVAKRYLLLQFTSNFWGTVSANNELHCGDISITTRSATNCNDVIGLGLSMDADLNHDCYVNLLDLEILVSHWMDSCASHDWCQGADLNYSGIVNLQCFSGFATKWLECNNPVDLKCHAF